MMSKYLRCKVLVINGNGSKIQRIHNKNALMVSDFFVPRSIGKETTSLRRSPLMSIISFIISRGIWTKREKMKGKMQAGFPTTIPPRIKPSPVMSDTIALPRIVFFKRMSYAKSKIHIPSTRRNGTRPRLLEKNRAIIRKKSAKSCAIFLSTFPDGSGRSGWFILSISIS